MTFLPIYFRLVRNHSFCKTGTGISYSHIPPYTQSPGKAGCVGKLISDMK